MRCGRRFGGVIIIGTPSINSQCSSSGRDASHARNEATERIGACWRTAPAMTCLQMCAGDHRRRGLGQQGPGTKPVAIRTQVPLGSAPPVRSPFATPSHMHMIASKRPSVLERVRGVLADRDLLILLGLALAVRLAAIVVFPSLHH